MGKVNQLLQDQQQAEFDKYLKDHPEASEEEAHEAVMERYERNDD